MDFARILDSPRTLDFARILDFFDTLDNFERHQSIIYQPDDLSRGQGLNPGYTLILYKNIRN